MKKFIIAMTCVLLTVAPVSNVFGMDPLLEPKVEKKEEVKKLPPVMIMPDSTGNKSQQNPFAYQKHLPPEFPKVEFSTAMIGQFMTFCGNVMMQRFRYENVMPQIAQVSTGFVCSCIMDSYRSNASEAEFKYEFTRNTAKEVPLFTEYLGQCSAMNAKNMMMLRNYYGARPTAN